jgi:hypothetical protein
MKYYFVAFLLSFLLASCGTSQSQPQVVDNGKPGQIKAITFYDENHNQVFDQGEIGLVDNISISQDVSCPPSDLKNITRMDTGVDGTALFTNLKPGNYCVAYMGGRTMDTNITKEVAVSSEQETLVYFGLTDK